MASPKTTKSSTDTKSSRGKSRQDRVTTATGGTKTGTLNDRQQRFVDEYLIDLNATQAAIRAGYSQKTAQEQSSRLLSNVMVAAAVAEGRQRTAQRLELTRDDCIRQYQRMAFSDPRKLYDAYGQIKPIHKLDDDTAAAVQGIEVEYRLMDGPGEPPVPVLKIKMADRKGSLDSIMKAQGWNSAEKHEVTGKNGGAIEHAVRVVLVPPKVHAQATVRSITKTDIGD